MFGYMPDFIKAACHQQLEDGVEIGPMHPLAAVARSNQLRLLFGRNPKTYKC
jgi:hypothetical protein